MREYEFICITRSDVPEKEKKDHIEKYEKALTMGGGQILKKDDWGVKRLAYPIKKHFHGHYHIYDLVTDHANITETERLMGIDDKVLRFMSLKISDHCDVEARKKQLAEAPVVAARSVEEHH